MNFPFDWKDFLNITPRMIFQLIVRKNVWSLKFLTWNSLIKSYNMHLIGWFRDNLFSNFAIISSNFSGSRDVELPICAIIVLNTKCFRMNDTVTQLNIMLGNTGELWTTTYNPNISIIKVDVKIGIKWTANKLLIDSIASQRSWNISPNKLMLKYFTVKFSNLKIKNF